MFRSAPKILSAAVVLHCSSPEPLPAQDVDVTAYEIDVAIGPAAIEETVILSATSRRPVKRLALQLASSVKIVSCRVGDRDVPFERSGWDLVLDLGKAGSPGGDFSLQFELEGSPYNKQSSGHLRTVISEEHAYIRHQYAWYPRRSEDLATHETTVHARSDWQVRTAGLLASEERDGDRTTWVFVQDNPCTEIGLVAGERVTVSVEGEGGIELDALVFAGHEQGAEVLLGAAARAISFYTELLGPMSEDRFTLVEMPAAFGAGSGYGEVGYALIGTGAFENAESATWAEMLVAHEVSHTWWGREVIFSDFSNEMLATYSTLRYLEAYRGESAARVERASMVRKVAQAADRSPLISLEEIEGWGGGMEGSTYTVLAYDKGAMLLHILEREVGRKVFDQALAKLSRDHRNQVIGYAGVKKALGGSRHKGIFTLWEQPGLPALSVENEVKKSGSSYTVQGSLVQQGTDRPYAMNVTLRALAGEDAFDHVVKVKKRETRFKFTCPFEPAGLVIDPEFHLLCARTGEVDIEALTEQIFRVANSPKQGDLAVLKKTVQSIRKVLASGQEPGSHFYTALGRCLFRLGELDAAREAFETALQGGAGGPFHRCWVQLRLGCIADLEKDRSRAESHYRKVLEFSDASNHQTQKQCARRWLEKPYRGYEVDG